MSSFPAQPKAKIISQRYFSNRILQATGKSLNPGTVYLSSSISGSVSLIAVMATCPMFTLEKVVSAIPIRILFHFLILFLNRPEKQPPEYPGRAWTYGEQQWLL